MNLVASVRSGDRLALSRLLSQIENDLPEGRAALSDLFAETGRAHLVGVTGAPGTGKSSLVNRLAKAYRSGPAGRPASKVAIVAVDPTSPFTGGAILGDRIRMRDLAGDPGVFIRSMASRGALGGLAATTAGVVMAFDAAGYEAVFIETVGAGQVEVDIARLAHTTLVVEAPGLGDDVQAIKAGILEIADILVVNKADRPGAEQAARALKAAIQLAHPTPKKFQHHGQLLQLENRLPSTTAPADIQKHNEAGWISPVLLTTAIEGTGIEELQEMVESHRRYLVDSGEWAQRERARLKASLDNLLHDTLVARWRAEIPETEYQSVLDRVVARSLSPRQAVAALIGENGQP